MATLISWWHQCFSCFDNELLLIHPIQSWWRLFPLLCMKNWNVIMEKTNVFLFFLFSVDSSHTLKLTVLIFINAHMLRIYVQYFWFQQDLGKRFLVFYPPCQKLKKKKKNKNWLIINLIWKRYCSIILTNKEPIWFCNSGKSISWKLYSCNHFLH